MILFGLMGMRFDQQGVRFQPCVPSGIVFVEIQNMKYRNMDLHVTIRGSGIKVKECTINGQVSEASFLNASNVGRQHVVMVLSPR
jgi:cellobiose phosphorylase